MINQEISKNIAMYLWEKAGAFPCAMEKYEGTEANTQTYSDMCLISPRPRHLSIYQHLLKLCEPRTDIDIKSFFSYVCTMDYLLGYFGRRVDDIRFVIDGDGYIIDIVPPFTPYAFEDYKYDPENGLYEPSYMFASDARTNLDVVGTSVDFNIRILLDFAAEVEEYIAQYAPDVSEEDRLSLKENLQQRISFVKKIYRHEIYKLDYEHREDDEAVFYLRKSRLPESEPNIEEMKELKSLVGINDKKAAAVNAAALMKNKAKAEVQMDILSKIF